MMCYEGYPLSVPWTEELHGVVMKKISKKKCRHSNEAAQPATYLCNCRVLPLSAVQLESREPDAPIRLF